MASLADYQIIHGLVYYVTAVIFICIYLYDYMYMVALYYCSVFRLSLYTIHTPNSDT